MEPTDTTVEPTDRDALYLHRAKNALSTLEHYVESGYTDLDEWAVRVALRRLKGQT